MPNSQAFSSLFMTEALDSVHDLSVDTIKAALYRVSANIGLNTIQYTTSGEVTGLNYVAGGVVVQTLVPPAAQKKITYWTPSANIVYDAVTILQSFNAVLLYNASKSNKSLGVWTFTPSIVNASVFTLRVPANNPTTALLRWRPQ